MKSSIDVFLKCQTADLHLVEVAFAVNDIAQKYEVVCGCRMERHAVRTHDLLQYWQEDLSPEDKEDMSRAVTEKDLSIISQAIGGGWQHLGTELGISKVQMEHIYEENEKVSMRIYCMLTQWLNQNTFEATVNALFNAMNNCSGLNYEKEETEQIFADSYYALPLVVNIIEQWDGYKAIQTRRRRSASHARDRNGSHHLHPPKTSIVIYRHPQPPYGT